MKIDPSKPFSAMDMIRSTGKAKTQQAVEKQAQARDAIRISDDTRNLPDLARKSARGEEVRQSVLKRYADFVDKPLNISDQNILSAVKRSLIT